MDLIFHYAILEQIEDSIVIKEYHSDGKGGFIDLLWKGVLLVEHKSRGKSLDRAFHQAIDYFPGLKERDLPRYVLVSDFARFRLYDLKSDPGELKDLAELAPYKDKLEELKKLHEQVWSAIPVVKPFGGNKLIGGGKADGPEGPDKASGK